jgi:hypothetical protein
MSVPVGWRSHAYLDALRPQPGWSVRTAILASYSADLGSIGAALLALAGLDDERGSGSRAAIAEAIEELRNKVRILIQRGRLAKLKRLPAVAGILDQFVTEVAFNETERSWHPKLALVCFDHPEAAPSWHFWIGSRNLTAAENLDLGLLVTSATAKGDQIEGLVSVAERLGELAALPELLPQVFGRQVGQVRWTAPTGIKVRNVRLTAGRGDEPRPDAPNPLDEVIVISPFLDGGFVGAVSQWGDARTRRTLFSTHTEIRNLAGRAQKPLEGFRDRLLAFDEPVRDEVETAEIPGDTPDNPLVEAGAEETAPLGLHAKILAVQSGRKLRVWVGSANATDRAWRGRNVEVIAELDVDLSLRSGIDHLINQGRPVTEAELVQEPAVVEDSDRDRLNRAREQVAGRWSGRLMRDGDAFSLLSATPPHPSDREIALEVGLATGAAIPWPRGTTEIDLGRYPTALHTELVHFRLSLNGRECNWLQRCAAEPPLDETRDRAALARHLGPKAFLEWLRALLHGTGSNYEADDPWDKAAEAQGAQREDLGPEIDDLTLEDMLSCWARDRKAFARVNHRLRTFLDPVMAESADLNAEDLARLQTLRAVWETVSSELLEKS